MQIIDCDLHKMVCCFTSEVNRCQSVVVAGKSCRLSTLGSAWNSVNDTCAITLCDVSASLNVTQKHMCWERVCVCETPFPQTPTPAGVSLHSDPGDVSSFDAANVQSAKLPFAVFTSSFLFSSIKKLGWDG